MHSKLIFLPVLAQILLTVTVFFALGVAKGRAAKAGLVDEARRALHADAWPDNVIQLNNNIRNQFEIPVLFYVLAITLWALDAAGPLSQALAWLFVISRVVHAYIHTGVNFVPWRRRVFSIGVLLVLALAVCALIALLR